MAEFYMNGNIYGIVGFGIKDDKNMIEIRLKDLNEKTVKELQTKTRSPNMFFFTQGEAIKTEQEIVHSGIGIRNPKGAGSTLGYRVMYNGKVCQTLATVEGSYILQMATRIIRQVPILADYKILIYLITQNSKILNMCLVLHAINLKGLFFLCAFLFVSCTYKPGGTEDANSLPKNGTESVKSDSVMDNMLKSYINSLDIRMELEDSIVNKLPNTLQMNIINNSNYKLLTGSRYSLKYFESEIWKSISQLESTIWTDIEISVEPQSSRGLEAILFIRTLKPGKYRIEKEFVIAIPTIKRNTNNIRIILSDEFILN